MTIFALACMFVIGVLTGIIGIVAYVVHLDEKHEKMFGKDNDVERTFKADILYYRD